MKIFGSVLIFVLQIAVAATGLLFLIIALNGFHEREATPGIVFYMIFGVLSAIGLAVAVFFTAKMLAGKHLMGDFAALALSVVGYGVIGLLLIAFDFLAAVIIVSVLRDAGF